MSGAGPSPVRATRPRQRGEVGPPLSARARIAIVVALAALTAAAAAAPGPLGSPIRRLASYDADGPDPIYNVPVDGSALRLAGRLIPSRATYFVYTPSGAGQLRHDLSGAGSLFFSPALPVSHARDAGWILSYQAETLVPHGLRSEAVYRLGDGIYLVKVGRR